MRRNKIPTAPNAMAAIQAIKEKAKLSLPQSQEEYEKWSEKMEGIDRKYGFLEIKKKDIRAKMKVEIDMRKLKGCTPINQE